MVEMRRDKVYSQIATVKDVEERFRTVYVSGTGKDAKTEEQTTGWWITFVDNPTVINIEPREFVLGKPVCPPKPDVQPGWRAVCTWEFRP